MIEASAERLFFRLPFFMNCVDNHDGFEPNIIKNFHCFSREFLGSSNQNLEIINLYIKIHNLLCRQKLRPKTTMTASIPNYAETETGFLAL